MYLANTFYRATTACILATGLSLPAARAARAPEGEWSRFSSWLALRGPDDEGVYHARIDVRERACDGEDRHRLTDCHRKAVHWLCQRMRRKGETIFAIPEAPAACSRRILATIRNQAR